MDKIRALQVPHKNGRHQNGPTTASHSQNQRHQPKIVGKSSGYGTKTPPKPPKNPGNFPLFANTRRKPAKDVGGLMADVKISKSNDQKINGHPHKDFVKANLECAKDAPLRRTSSAQNLREKLHSPGSLPA